jgi:hypothetical protein
VRCDSFLFRLCLFRAFPAGSAGLGQGLSAGSLEGVEDKVEADLELIAVVIAGLEDVPGGKLGEVGILLGGKLPGDLLRDLRRLLRGAEWQARFLQRESVDVAVEQGVAWAVSSIEKPAPRRHPSTASWWRSVAGPGEIRDSIRPIAQRCRARTSRAEMARWRMAGFQPASLDGRPISLNTTSTMPSRRSPLLATWLYSDMASTPEHLAELAHAKRIEAAHRRG